MGTKKDLFETLLNPKSFTQVRNGTVKGTGRDGTKPYFGATEMYLEQYESVWN